MGTEKPYPLFLYKKLFEIILHALRRFFNAKSSAGGETGGIGFQHHGKHLHGQLFFTQCPGNRFKSVGLNEHTVQRHLTDKASSYFMP